MSDSPQAPSFDMHMLALGRLCVTWATLDRHLTELISAYTGLSSSMTACVVAASDNIAPRCEILRLLAAESTPSPEWQSDFMMMVDIIRQQLAPLRNRFVHDYWTLSEGTLQRLESKASAKRPQAMQPHQLTFQRWHDHQPSEVDNLAVRVASIILVVRVAQADVQDWRRGQGQFRGSLTKMKMILKEVGDPGWSGRTPRAR